MEQFDIYNAQKEKIGKLGRRGIDLPKDEFRFVVTVIIFNEIGDKVLIQKRQASKSSWANMWDFTAGGGVLAGETLQQAAERELFEEMGIVLDLSKTSSRLTVSFYEGWDEIFIVKKDINLDKLKLQIEEVADAMWVTHQELSNLLANGNFIPYIYTDNIFDYGRFDGEFRQN